MTIAPPTNVSFISITPHVHALELVTTWSTFTGALASIRLSVSRCRARHRHPATTWSTFTGALRFIRLTIPSPGWGFCTNWCQWILQHIHIIYTHMVCIYAYIYIYHMYIYVYIPYCLKETQIAGQRNKPPAQSSCILKFYDKYICINHIRIQRCVHTKTHYWQQYSILKVRLLGRFNPSKTYEVYVDLRPT